MKKSTAAKDNPLPKKPSFPVFKKFGGVGNMRGFTDKFNASRFHTQHKGG